MNNRDYEKDKNKTLNKVPVRQYINFDNKNNKNPKVSVVIPIFNVEDYLPQCLDSVINQTLTDIEIICVNDGSTDSSLRILEEYLSKDDRIKIIDKENAGYGHTMNIGMDMASGEYIAIVESDDYILKDMLTTLYDVASKNQLDFVKSDFYRFYGEDDKLIKEYYTINPDHTMYGKLISTSDTPESYTILMNTWTGIYNTEFLRKNNIRHNETAGASYQDNGFWFKTFFYGQRVMFVPEPFYMYRRDNPNSSVKNKEKVYAMDKEYELIYDFLEESGRKEEFIPAFTYAKYHNFHFTMDRIEKEFKKDFLLSTSENFNQMIKDNEFDPILLDEYDQNILKWIIEKPNEYYQYKYELNENDYQYLKKFSECRIDFKNHGSNDNNLILLDCNDPLAKITQPGWFNDDDGVGSIVRSINGYLDLTFKCVNDGNLIINFRGIDYKDNSGNRIPIFVDYTELIIDDVHIISGSVVSWHDDPFVYEQEVKDGQIINLKIRWLPLNVGSNIRILSDNDIILNKLMECRIDLKNHGNKDNDLIFIDQKDSSCNIYQPNWFKDDKGIGSVVNSSEGELKLCFKCVNDGNLVINFRGIDYKDKDGNRIPIFVNYTNITIDDVPIIKNDIISWHDNPFIYNKKVTDGQIVKLQVNWSQLSNKENKNIFTKSDMDYLIRVLDDKNSEIKELKAKINRVKSENTKLQEFRSEVLNSNSWKLTKYLRSIKNH